MCKTGEHIQIYSIQYNKAMMRKRKASMGAVMLFLLIIQSYANYIISVDSTSYTVSNSANITVTIKTSTSYSLLDLAVSSLFTINNPACTLNTTITPCTKIVPPSGATLRVRFSYNFIANQNYTLRFNASNPTYSDSFVVQAFAGSSTEFGNSGSLQIQPKNMSCSISPSSNVVSQLANTTFLIGVSTLAAGTLGKISIIVNLQTQFPNVINTGPTCFADGIAYACSLSQVFGQQMLSIASVPVGYRSNGTQLPVLINSLRNAPYNSTFETITITVKDSQDRDVQTCSVQQPGASVLQQSSFFVIQGWGALVGQVSNVQFLLTPYFTPLSDITVLLVYDKAMIITPKAPAQFTTTTQGNYSYLMVSNTTYSSSILQFNATVSNPSSTVPLSMHSYILYNSTLFRQHEALPSGQLTLRKQTVSVSAVVANPTTLVPTSMNVSMVFPITVSAGFVIKFTLDYGQIQCSNLNMVSIITATAITVSSCSSNRISVQVSSSVVSASTVWVSFNYVTYTSIISNTMVVDISSTGGYAIMNGSSAIAVSVSQPLFTIASSNSTFTASSNYTFAQANSTPLNASVVRTVIFIPPLYVKVSQNTTLIPSSSATTITNYYIDLATNQVAATVTGVLNVVLNFVKNPTHYLGGRQWQITCKDTSGYNSSYSTAMHTPQYSPARSFIGIQLINNTIQQTTNVTLTYEPLLQYDLSNAPLVVTEFSKSSINSVDALKCKQCVLLTSTKFKMPYYSVVMRPVIQIINNEQPFNNNVTFTIAIGDFVYEVGSIVYDLVALQYEYVATFQGEYTNLGQLQIKITTILTKPVNLSYSGTGAIFSASQQCLQCNSTYLKITGIVGYFQNTNVIIEGMSNGILYARAVVPIYYTCSSIPGCQICETINSTFQCTRCFSSQFTSNNLLFQGRCYSVCPTSTYASGALCEPCPNLCYRCNANACLECITPYYIYLQTCVLQCPPFFIKNATHCLPRPIICPSHCIDCPSDNVCNKCDASYYLLQNLCYTACPSNYLPNDVEYTCILFIPPQETSYFPFAFLIASFVLLVLLGVIKKFERRSLIMGNLIAAASLLQIGAIVMLMGYTFMSISTQPDRWLSQNKLLMQALIFIIVLTKVALNVIFIVYFLRKIAPDQEFQKWLEKSDHNKKLYLTLIILSGVLSFQIMRIIYSRFLGLQLFFGRFNTSLIFKPLNFFSLAYIVPGGCLILMAIFDITVQNGYRTSIFYSSIQVILMQIFIFIACFVAFFKGDQQYFDYQVYKVQNASEHNSAAKIQINQQQEDGASYNQKLINSDGSKNTGPVGHSPSQFGLDSTGKIIRNMRWRQAKQKKQKPLKNFQRSEITVQQVKSNQNLTNQENKNQQNKQQILLRLNSNADLDKQQGKHFNNAHDRNKDRSIFRKKILEDWQKIKRSLPQAHTGHKIIKAKAKSKSPLALNKSQLEFEMLKNSQKPKQLVKVSSLQKIEKVQLKLPMPIPSYANKSKLKQHYYSIRKIGHQNKDIGNETSNIKNETKKQGEYQANVFDDKYSIDLSEQKTIAMQNNNKQDDLQTGLVITNRTRFPTFNLQEGKNDGDLSDIQNNSNEQSFEKSLMQLRKDIKTNRYDDFDNQIIDEDEEVEEPGNSKNETEKSIFNKNKKKIKKRNVNRQTQAVYLQRLVSSSEAHRAKPFRRQKLDDF